MPPIAAPLLEERERLSRSGLWRLQRIFFEEMGREAWTTGGVPHFVTDNPFIAGAHARVIAGYLLDLHEAGALDGAPGEPLYIVELGAGSGRFAWHFLRALARLRQRPPLRDIPLRYVMTDLASRNVEAWLTHPELRRTFEAGVLDAACFDLERDEEARLRVSGAVLGPGSLARPLVVIANYVFDSVPQDAFYSDGSVLHESLLSVAAPDLEAPEGGDLMASLRLRYDRFPVAPDYYEDPSWNRILAEHVQVCAGGAFSFPCVALRAVERLAGWSGGRALLLSADKGHDREATVVGRREPEPVFHGSFSMPVNHHAIASWTRLRGGDVLLTERWDETLSVCAFVLGGPPGCAATRQAFGEAIDAFGPGDFLHLKQGFDRTCDGLDVDQVLSFLRLSGWDARVFQRCQPRLVAALGEASAAVREKIVAAVHRVWDAHFFVDEEDVAFDIGVVLGQLGQHAAALAFYERSLELHGPHAHTHFNMAVCLHRLGAADAAQAAVERARALGLDR